MFPDGGRCENYCPITVASFLSRAYFCIFDDKLGKVIQFTLYQKGFKSELLPHLNNNARDMVLVQVGVNKTFKRIPHSALAAPLRAKSLPVQVIHIVEDLYLT